MTVKIVGIMLTLKTFRFNRAKMSKAQKEDRVKQKKASYLKSLQQDD